MIVSFDIDGTLLSYDGKPIDKIISKAKEHLKKDKVIIVTRRGYYDTHVGINGERIMDWIKSKVGDVPIYFTNGLPKFRTLLNHGVELHYDDDKSDLQAATNKGIKGVLVEEDKSKDRDGYLSRREDLSDKTLLFIDSGGIYQSYAERLSHEFGTVKYFSNWDEDESDLRASKYATGDNIGFDKIKNYEPHVYSSDVIFFPGCTRTALQEDLISRGFNVWGSGSLEEIENNRELFLDKVKEWGMKTPEYVVAEGIDNLLRELEKVPKGEVRYIKFSRFRTDMETYKHWNFKASKLKYEKLRATQGAKSDTTRFIIVTPIQGSEGGRDTYCVQGLQPDTFMAGYEVKDKSYISRVVSNENMPQPMIEFANKIAELSEQRMVSCFWSDEARVESNKFFPLDFTARLGLPPNEIQQCNILNLGEIIYYGSQGTLVQPIFKNTYAVQIFITTDEDEGWLAYEYPEYLSSYIKPYNHMVDEDGDKWIIKPYGGMICAVVGLGSTLEEARDNCLSTAKEVKGEGLSYNEHEFDDMYDIIEEGKENGLTYFD